jgi:protoheme IX farnesyltransferase
MSVIAPARSRAPLREAIADYVSLTKPRIIGLLDATALAAMVAAGHGRAHLTTVAAVLVGGSLAAGGAHSINCWYDRDIDRVMTRTTARPVPAGRIPAWHALTLGVVFNSVAFVVLWAWANLLAAGLAMLASAIYVGVYTMWLKRATPQNIVIGGASGAIPPLVGWAAATGSLDWTALGLFLVIFLWTPTHFWALAQLGRRDYERAGVPMMPVVRSLLATKRQSLVYACLTAAASLIPFATGAVGFGYLVGAVLLGAGFVGISTLDLLRSGWTRRVFAFSIVYLAVLFTLFALSATF